MKKVAILGASGSIGTNTIEVIRRHQDRFSLISFSVYNQTDKLEGLLEEFKTIKLVAVKKLEDVKDLMARYPNVTFAEGSEGLNMVATSDADIVVGALVGFVGLVPILNAIKKGTDIALANKETLVAAGEIVMEEAKKHNVHIYPVDSEHSAIFQCLEKENRVKNIILTASGGPFFRKTLEELENVTLSQALNHPTWKMGNKITIDSATMFNKAFEIIEAYYLFHVKPSQIKVLIHPQSVVHSMVEFDDGAIKAELAVSDMKVAISYALDYPNRLENIAEQLDFRKISSLEFYEPDLNRFKPLALAYKALEEKGIYPTIMNAANEEAVYLFMDGKIKFNDIYNVVIDALGHFDNIDHKLTIEDVMLADKNAREYVRRKYSC